MSEWSDRNDGRAKTPLFGYGPAEEVKEIADIVLDPVVDNDMHIVDDEAWMYLIAEGKFDRSIPRHYHGTKRYRSKKCPCFLCSRWRADESANRVTEEKVIPLEDPSHPMHRKVGKLG